MSTVKTTEDLVLQSTIKIDGDSASINYAEKQFDAYLGADLAKALEQIVSKADSFSGIVIEDSAKLAGNILGENPDVNLVSANIDNVGINSSMEVKYLRKEIDEEEWRPKVKVTSKFVNKDVLLRAAGSAREAMAIISADK